MDNLQTTCEWEERRVGVTGKTGSTELFSMLAGDTKRRSRMSPVKKGERGMKGEKEEPGRGRHD